jgi:hypothetical protein
MVWNELYSNGTPVPKKMFVIVVFLGESFSSLSAGSESATKRGGYCP